MKPRADSQSSSAYVCKLRIADHPGARGRRFAHLRKTNLARLLAWRPGRQRKVGLNARIAFRRFFVWDLWANSHSRRQHRARNTRRDIALRPEKPRYEQIIFNQSGLNTCDER